MPRPKFTIVKSPENSYYFNLVARDDEKILISERYSQPVHVVWGIGGVQRSAAIDARYEKLVGNGGEYYFVLHDGNGAPLGKSAMYPSQAAREGAIDLVKRYAPEAELEA